MTDTDRWLFVGALALVAFVIKGLGPLTLGGRELPAWAGRVVPVLAAPLLCALVVMATLVDGPRWAVGAQTAGVLVAGLLLWRTKIPLVAAALVAMVVTGVVRALG